METVWILNHAYEQNGHDEVKFIGVYASREQGEAVIAQLCEQPGFRERPEGFDLEEHKSGLVGWPEGFVTHEIFRYLAVLVLRADVAGVETATPLREVQYRLLWADDDEDAYTRALKLGAAEELEYENDRGERVSWRFEGLRDLDEVFDLHEYGTEIYSQHSRTGPLVVEKHQLLLFWKKSHDGRTAGEILDEEP